MRIEEDPYYYDCESDPKLDDFMSQLCTDMSRGIRINKDTLGERIEKYNEKYGDGLDQDSVLFWAFDSGLQHWRLRYTPL
jgi:hypothetical protein